MLVTVIGLPVCAVFCAPLREAAKEFFGDHPNRQGSIADRDVPDSDAFRNDGRSEPGGDTQGLFGKEVASVQPSGSELASAEVRLANYETNQQDAGAATPANFEAISENPWARPANRGPTSRAAEPQPAYGRQQLPVPSPESIHGEIGPNRVMPGGDRPLADVSPNATAWLESPPEVAENPAIYDAYYRRFDKLGMLTGQLQYFQGEPPLYHFQCRMALAEGHTTYAKQFEATGPTPTEALDRVLADVEKWRQDVPYVSDSRR